MAILEALTTGIGAAVAKGLLKIWLKDDPISQNVGATLIDLIQKTGADTFRQKKALKQFDEITKAAAQSVQRLLADKYSEMDEERQVFVSNAAAATVANTIFSTDTLVKANLQADDLLAQFLDMTGAEGGNPELVKDKSSTTEERSLYRDILSESAQFVIDGASELPDLERFALGELLKGQDLLAEAVKRLLAKLEAIDEASATNSSESETQAIEKSYRRAVAQRLNVLQLFGLETSMATRKYGLSTAYIALEVAKSSTKSSSYTNYEEDEEDQIKSSHEYEFVNVVEAILPTRRIFIRGDAGSGKTTLLQWIGLNCALGNHEPRLHAWNNAVPFLVRLRDYANKPLPSVQDLPKWASRIIVDYPKYWSRDLLSTGNATILIDGLDELPEDRHQDVRDWLNDLLYLFPDARYVVTTRPNAVSESWLDNDQFTVATLQSMSFHSILEFIEHWHAAVCESLRNSEEISETKSLIPDLVEKIRHSNTLRRLASSPLLCAVICALHRDKVRNLPNERIELYDECIKLFLRRDMSRKVALRNYSFVGERAIRLLLTDLAYWYIRVGIVECDATDVDDRLQAKIDTLNGFPAEASGNSLRRWLTERIGLLREPATGRIDFPHKTFQEYLAATEIVRVRDQKILVSKARDTNWREIIILTAAKLESKEEAEKLVNGLLKQFRKHNEFALLIIAAECYGAMMLKSEILDVSLETELATVLPPQKIGDAKGIAAAGEIVVPYVRHKDGLSVKQAAACLRVLTEVGSELASDAVVEWAHKDNRIGVWNEIGRHISQTGNRSIVRAREISLRTNIAIRNSSDVTSGSFGISSDLLNLSSFDFQYEIFQWQSMETHKLNARLSYGSRWEDSEWPDIQRVVEVLAQQPNHDFWITPYGKLATAIVIPFTLYVHRNYEFYADDIKNAIAVIRKDFTFDIACDHDTHSKAEILTAIDELLDITDLASKDLNTHWHENRVSHTTEFQQSKDANNILSSNINEIGLLFKEVIESSVVGRIKK